jgi:hypothetical protein
MPIEEPLEPLCAGASPGLTDLQDAKSVGQFGRKGVEMA